VESGYASVIKNALQEFNASIADQSLTGFEHFNRVVRRYRLRGDYRRDFVLEVAPLLCDRAEFLRLREVENFDNYSGLAEAGDRRLLSLGLAFAAAEGHVEQAADILYRMVHIPTGWPKTECIRYAIEHIHHLSQQGEADELAVEKVRYSFLAFIDAFKGDWFSRLHDVHLIRCMAGLLADASLFTS